MKRNKCVNVEPIKNNQINHPAYPYSCETAQIILISWVIVQNIKQF